MTVCVGAAFTLIPIEFNEQERFYINHQQQHTAKSALRVVVELVVLWPYFKACKFVHLPARSLASQRVQLLIIRADLVKWK